MVAFFLRLYDWFSRRRGWLFALLAVLCALLLAGMLSLGRNEDILDFLPVDTTHRRALNLYQELSASDRIVAIVLPRDTAVTVPPERLAEAVDRFAAEVTERDSLHRLRDLTTRIDYEHLAAVPEFVYAHIPYFLDEGDYARIDSLLTPAYIDAQIARDRMLLMFPTGSLLSQHLRQDPLNLFTPAVARLQQFQLDLKYELYDGYILTPDRRRAVVMMRTSYGSNETDGNARLVDLLSDAASATSRVMPEVEIHLSGAPVIAVTNARQIKNDSLWAISIAVVLILGLLVYTLRSLRSLLLIGVTILFGWLFAMGCLSLFRDEVSMIILGIASIIIGIAVNYPLHLLAHLHHEQQMRTVLREMVSPLVIGNLTTVGAFLCLVPMTAPALRDLGLFAAFMLVGTILFVLIFLPHLADRRRPEPTREHALLEPLTRLSFDNRPRIFVAVCLLTVVFGFLSRHTAFDTDLQHINYMTREQRSDLEAFRTMLGGDSLTTVYVASEGRTWDEALQRSERARSELEREASACPGARLKSATPFLPSQAEQQRRLARWEQFRAQHAAMIRERMAAALSANGFRPDAFAGFDDLLERRFEPMPWSAFEPLAATLFDGYLGGDGPCPTVVDRLEVPPSRLAAVEASLRERVPDSYNFDVRGLNSTIANALTGDFNYICWSCGVIVFLFLWFSFGRLELSLMAFLPMTVSWLWILGIMDLADIRFNLVNIILATFIFGQGDDYTIFITEGLIYEHAYGRKLLGSYKKSIVVSALIMLIGIGTLILSRHPAMRSLAEVTIVGMFAVVLMAYIIPPFIYRWLVRDAKGAPRRNPVTLGRLFATAELGLFVAVEQAAALLLALFTGNNRRLLRRFMHRAAAWNLRHLAGIRFRQLALPNEPNGSTPALSVSSAQKTPSVSADSAALTAPAVSGVPEAPATPATPAALAAPAASAISAPPATGQTARPAPLSPDAGRLLAFCCHTPLDLLAVIGCFDDTIVATDRRLPRGLSLLLRMTHTLTPRSRARAAYDAGLRVAFPVDEPLDFEVPTVPVGIHGSRELQPDGGVLLAAGTLTVAWGAPALRTTADAARSVEAFERSMHRMCADTAWYRPQVLARYLYKGPEVESRCRRLLRECQAFSRWIDGAELPRRVVIVNNGQGELGLLFALVHPATEVYAFESDVDRLALARHVACLPVNLHLAPESELDAAAFADARWYLFRPTDDQRRRYPSGAEVWA